MQSHTTRSRSTDRPARTKGVWVWTLVGLGLTAGLALPASARGGGGGGDRDRSERRTSVSVGVSDRGFNVGFGVERTEARRSGHRDRSQRVGGERGWHPRHGYHRRPVERVREAVVVSPRRGDHVDRRAAPSHRPVVREVIREREVVRRARPGTLRTTFGHDRRRDRGYSRGHDRGFGRGFDHGHIRPGFHHRPARPLGRWERRWCPPVYREVRQPCGTVRRVCVRPGRHERVWVRIEVGGRF